ncbi:MAG: glycosyltransferase family 39 protein [Gemmataceae bacterium]|nr:glycosyltransferase family 39 protein [Gemmataceae bacterium]
MLLLQIVGIAIGSPLLCFGFGWSVLGRVSSLDGEERFAASWGVGFAVFAIAQFVAFLAGVDQVVFNAVTLAILLGLTVVCQYFARRPADGFPLWPLAILWTAAYLYLVGVQCLLPIYVGSDWWGDWMMHYENALIFRGERGVDTKWIDTYSLASRTPLFNLTSAFVMSLSGGQFWAFQLVSSLMNIAFVAALYLVMRDLFGRRMARLALVLVPLNLWLLHMAWFTWPKMLTAYFILMGFHFYLQFIARWTAEPGAARFWLVGFWISFLLGYLTHQVAAIYLIALLMHLALLVWKEGFRIRRVEIAWLGCIAIVLVGPWYAWLAWTFGADRIGGSTPVTLMDPKASFGPLNVLEYMAINGLTSVVPNLPDTLLGGPLTFERIYNAATVFYFSLLPGALTVSVCLLVASCRWTMEWNVPARKSRLPLPNPEHERGVLHCGAVFFFLLFGTLGALALHPARTPHGVAHSALFPSVIVLIALTWRLVMDWPRRWRIGVGIGIIAENLLMLWSHVAFTATPDFLDWTGFNVREKERFNAVLLNDVLGSLDVVAVAAVIVGQVAFGAILLRWLAEGTDEHAAALAAFPDDESRL